MPASKTKEVRTPKYRESIMSDLIRRAAGTEFGPAWANKAPQGKITKMRDYGDKKRKAKDGTLLDRETGSTLLDSIKGALGHLNEPAGDPKMRKRNRLDRGKGDRLKY